jgi:tRNA(Ile)-lysidine synthase
MSTLAERFRAHLGRRRLLPPGGTALVAVSGGPDSVALLDLLAALPERRRPRLIVAHVDHGISPGSATVAAAVAALAARYGLPCEVGRLELGADTTETAARHARYAWLEATRARVGADWIVTAHHRDDQAETVLLRALRGSAPAGLAGIAARSRRGVVRPLLPFSRTELAEHARLAGLPTYADPANSDPRHLRSWLRGTVLPLLVERLGPRVRDDLVRVGTGASVERQAWDALLDRLDDLAWRGEGSGFSVARTGLRAYDPALAVAVLRAAGRRSGLVLGPGRARRLVALAGRPSGRRLSLGGGWMAEVAFERLHVQRGATPPMPITAGSEKPGQASFGEYALRWRPGTAPRRLTRSGWRTWLGMDEWEVRLPRTGDVIEPLGGVGRRPLRRLLMEARVPRRARARYPIVARGETILWIPGICRSAADVPAPGTRAVRVDVSEQ